MTEGSIEGLNDLHKYDSVTQWVRVNLPKEQIAEVIEHGMEGGIVSELIYYRDTVKFYDHFSKDIWSMLEDSTLSYGADGIIAYINHFHNVDNIWSETQFKNMLAWWAVETACQDMEIESQT